MTPRRAAPNKIKGSQGTLLEPAVPPCVPPGVLPVPLLSVPGGASDGELEVSIVAVGLEAAAVASATWAWCVSSGLGRGVIVAGAVFCGAGTSDDPTGLGTATLAAGVAVGSD